MYCSKCGTELKVEDSFCKLCGNKAVDQDTNAAAVPAVRVPVVIGGSALATTAIFSGVVSAVAFYFAGRSFNFLASSPNLRMYQGVPQMRGYAGVQDFKLGAIGGTIAILIGLVAWISLIIAAMKFLYRSWNAIQVVSPRTTPKKAYLLHLIPIFNWYWAFPAWYGLAQDFNKKIWSTAKGRIIEMPENLALAVPIAYVAGWLLGFVVQESQAIVLLANLATPILAGIFMTKADASIMSWQQLALANVSGPSEVQETNSHRGTSTTAPATPSRVQAAQESVVTQPHAEPIARQSQLLDLFKKGLISEEEYKSRKEG